MNTALRLTITQGDGEVLSLESWDPIILGRETGSDKGPFTHRIREKKCRVVIAERGSGAVSREHLLIEALDGARIRVTNKSQRHTVQMPNRATLRKGDAQELSLPASITLADLIITVVEPKAEEAPLRALEQAPPTPTGPILPRTPFAAVPGFESNEKAAEFYLRVVELTLNRLQAASDQKSIYDTATHALAEMLELDSVWLFLLEAGDWVVKSWTRRTEVTREMAGEASRFIMGKVRDETRTFWLTAQKMMIGVLPSVAAAPILAPDGKVSGIIYGHRLASEKPATVPFDRSLAVVVELVASAVASAQVASNSADSFAPLAGSVSAEFFPVTIARRLADAPHLLEDREQTIALLDCEIRDFESVLAQLGPVGASIRLQEALEPLTESIQDNQGVVAEFQDARIRAFWNAPVPLTDFLVQATQAALTILKRAADLSVRWRNDLGRSLDVGMTLHVGSFPVGRRGSRLRFKYGPWSSAWSTTDKMQEVGRALRTPLLLSRAARVQLPQSFAGRRLGRLEGAGWTEPMELFELLDPLDKAFAIRSRYEEALASFERGDFEATTQRGAKILAEHPSDVPAYLLQMRALQAKLNKGAAVTGVLKLMDTGA
jgi:class 3 adenylate cyclase